MAADNTSRAAVLRTMLFLAWSFILVTAWLSRILRSSNIRLLRRLMQAGPSYQMTVGSLSLQIVKRL